MATELTHSAIFKSSMVAAVAGAGVALLVAPQSGKQTRHVLKNRLTHINDKASGAVHSVRRTLRRNKQDQDEMDMVRMDMRLTRRDSEPSPILTNWEKEL